MHEHMPILIAVLCLIGAGTLMVLLFKLLKVLPAWVYVLAAIAVAYHFRGFIMAELPTLTNRIQQAHMQSARYVPQSLDSSVQVKAGANLANLDGKLVAVIPEISRTYHDIAGADYQTVITSGNDSPDHRYNSLHYADKAIDFRANDLDAVRAQQVFEGIKSELGDRYLVLLEDVGTARQHLHVQLRE